MAPPDSRRATAAADHATASGAPPPREPSQSRTDGAITGTVGAATTSAVGATTSATTSGSSEPAAPTAGASGASGTSVCTRELTRAPAPESAGLGATTSDTREEPGPSAASTAPPERPPRPVDRVDEAVDDAALPPARSPDTAAEPSEPDESANATGIAANADPTPKATAKAPTRPTCTAESGIR